MRRLFVGMVVAAATVLVPIWALAGNQEVAEQIAATLRRSGQLKSYRIGIKYQDGTAWLRGRVSSLEQMNTALELAFQAPGVTRVVNDLTIGSRDEVAEAATQHVRQAAGAVTPDRIARLALPGPSGRSQRVPVDPDSAKPAKPRSVGRADRVATAVASTPAVRKVAAAAAPQATPAPRRQQTQPEAGQTQMVVVGPAIAQPSVSPAPAEKVAASATQEPTAQAPQQQPQVVMAAVPRPVPQLVQPIPVAYAQAGAPLPLGQGGGGPVPQYVIPVGGGVAPARYDQPHLPNYAWPAYAAHPNYAALTYPKQYSPTAWPYIGPFYPYPQVPLGWRKVTLEWHDGWWQLDFDDGPRRGLISGLFRPCR